MSPGVLPQWLNEITPETEKLVEAFNAVVDQTGALRPPEELVVRPTHSPRSESDEEEGEGGAQRKKPRLDVPQQDTRLFSPMEVGGLSD